MRARRAGRPTMSILVAVLAGASSRPFPHLQPFCRAAPRFSIAVFDQGRPQRRQGAPCRRSVQVPPRRPAPSRSPAAAPAPPRQPSTASAAAAPPKGDGGGGRRRRRQRHRCPAACAQALPAPRRRLGGAHDGRARGAPLRAPWRARQGLQPGGRGAAAAAAAQRRHRGRSQGSRAAPLARQARRWQLRPPRCCQPEQQLGNSSSCQVAAASARCTLRRRLSPAPAPTCRPAPSCAAACSGRLGAPPAGRAAPACCTQPGPDSGSRSAARLGGAPGRGGERAAVGPGPPEMRPVNPSLLLPLARFLAPAHLRRLPPS